MMGTMMAAPTIVAIQTRTSVAALGVGLAAGPRAGTGGGTASAATAANTSGQTNRKLTPGSLTVVAIVRTAQTTSAPTWAPATEAQRRTIVQQASDTASASMASAAVYTPRNAGAPPHPARSWSLTIAVPAMPVRPAAAAVHTSVAVVPRSTLPTHGTRRRASLTMATSTSSVPMSASGSAHRSGYTTRPTSGRSKNTASPVTGRGSGPSPNARASASICDP